jgi:hypothetical protein
MTFFRFMPTLWQQFLGNCCHANLQTLPMHIANDIAWLVRLISVLEQIQS